MKPVTHSVISAATSGVFYYYTHSWVGAAACFLSGIFIDIDHILDFIINKKRLPRDYADLWSFCAEEKDGKLYLFLHSYELFIIFWILFFYYPWNDLWAGILIGMTVHVLSDQAANPLRPGMYCLAYRVKHNFSKKWLFNDEFYKTLK